MIYFFLKGIDDRGKEPEQHLELIGEICLLPLPYLEEFTELQNNKINRIWGQVCSPSLCPLQRFQASQLLTPPPTSAADSTTIVGGEFHKISPPLPHTHLTFQ